MIADSELRDFNPLISAPLLHFLIPNVVSTRDVFVPDLVVNMTHRLFMGGRRAPTYRSLQSEAVGHRPTMTWLDRTGLKPFE